MTVVNIPCDADTWINQNSQNADNSGTESIRIGDAIDTAARDAHGFLHFPIHSYVPVGAQITGVRLLLRFFDSDWTTSPTTATMNVYRVIPSWFDGSSVDWLNPWKNGNGPSSNQADWNAIPVRSSADKYSTVVGTFTRRRTDAVSNWHTIDFNASGVEMVQIWLDHQETPPVIADGDICWNGGIMLSGDAPGTASQKNAHYYRSRNYSNGAYAPTLEVTYIPDGAPLLEDACTPSLVTTTTARATARLLSDGGDALTDKGFFLQKAGEAAVYHSMGGGNPGGDGSFFHDFTGLTEGSQYSVFAFCQNDVGADYSPVGIFNTLNIVSKSGDGGPGITSNITGESKDYAGGGAGYHSQPSMRGTATHGGGAQGVAGEPNTGAGGGAGAPGGKGVAVVKYLVADAISATPALANDVFRPSVAYHNGLLIAPYAKSEGIRTVSYDSVTVANPAVIHAAGHDLESGQVVVLTGSMSGVYKVVDANKVNGNFTINALGVNGTGTVQYNQLVGYVRSGNGYEDGTLKTSRSSFHTGSLAKDYRYVSIIHEPLPDGCDVQLAYTIDDERTPTNGYITRDARSTSRESLFTISKQGYEVDIEVHLVTDGTRTPVLTGMNVVWNFVKIPKHLYSLDLRSGAGSGRWRDNPEEALKFLFDIANKEAVFEDRFSGEYNGVVEQIEYTQSNASLDEGPSGLVKLLVREVK